MPSSFCVVVSILLLCAEFVFLWNLDFVVNLPCSCRPQTTLSNSCFLRYFSFDLLSSFLLFYKLYAGGQPRYVAQVLPLSAPEPTADLTSGHHIHFFRTLIPP